MRVLVQTEGKSLKGASPHGRDKPCAHVPTTHVRMLSPMQGQREGGGEKEALHGRVPWIDAYTHTCLPPHIHTHIYAHQCTNTHTF